MKGKLGYKEQLDPEKSEYNREATRFFETAKRLTVIIKIERLHNEEHWKSYQFEKRVIEQQQGYSKFIEKTLFSPNFKSGFGNKFARRA